MSVQMQATKRRINSIVATRKITSAMELIAVTKLQRWQKYFYSSDKFTESFKTILNEYQKLEIKIESPYFLENKESSGILHVILTSNLGLCGAYNNNLIQYVQDKIKKDDTVLVIGKRGYREIKKTHDNIITSFINIGDDLSYDTVLKLGRLFTTRYKLKKDHQVQIHYTHYINSLTSEPRSITLLPLRNETNELEPKEKLAPFPIVEPDASLFLEELIPLYINALIMKVLIAAQVSEQSARRNAMEAATDNATDLIDELMIQYNTARQAAITQELTEVLGGSNV